MKKILFSFVVVLLSSGQYTTVRGQSTIHGKFWKQQALEDVIVPWTVHAIDQEYGAYHGFLEQDWTPYQDDHKFPGMIARHLFSYAVAYMLSGDDTYRQQAHTTYEYLIEKGWDQQFGGWYNELDKQGIVVDASKDLFMQTYAITGLTLYYLMTRDSTVKSYIDRSIALLEEKAWDKLGGGYVDALNRNLTVKSYEKAFSPQLAPLSGYLLYLYTATRDHRYLEMSERILQTVLDQMVHQPSGWIMERYDRDWQPVAGRNDWMNTGHNVEVAWILMRLYDLTHKEAYRQKAEELNSKLLRYAFDADTGIWYHQVRVDDAGVHTDNSPWWVQAYGNMFQLYMYHHSGNLSYLQHFRKGATFWNQYFMDSQHGGAFLSVLADGSIQKGQKAVRTKTSYHSMEHGLLNYLYLDVWVNHSHVSLHYHIGKSDSRKLYPLPIEEVEYEIQQVLIDGEPWEQTNYQEGYVVLPEDHGYTVEVRMKQR